MSNPAKQLEGMTLEGGWVVGKMIELPPNGTGGNFSCGYQVQNKDGTKAFLKALDYSRALSASDPARELQLMTEAYNFERDMLERCRNRHLDRVVRAITDGKVIVPSPSGGNVVQYLIFELAERDVRVQLDITGQCDLAWILRSLHQIATGLKQLHGEGIAHQDLKPSNVLVFDGSSISKVGDVGRAACKGFNPPHEDEVIAGDPSYAPLEQFYGYTDPEWTRRRLGCDTYLLGSMVVFFFTGLSMTHLLAKNLDKSFWPDTWARGYDEVLPYVQEAFSRAVDEFGSHISNAKLREELMVAVRQMCNPDPKHRGHPNNQSRNGNSFSMERYVGLFNLLAYRAKVGDYKG